MVGTETFYDHSQQLRRRHGVLPVYLPGAPKVSFRFGYDGSQSSVDEAPLRSGIIGRSAITKWSLVPGSAPFFKSKQQIKAMRSSVDAARVTVTKCDLPERKLPTGAGGHYVMSLMEFDPKGFSDDLEPILDSPDVTIYMAVAESPKPPNVIPAP